MAVFFQRVPEVELFASSLDYVRCMHCLKECGWASIPYIISHCSPTHRHRQMFEVFINKKDVIQLNSNNHPTAKQGGYYVSGYIAYVLTVIVNRISEVFCNISIRWSTALDIWNIFVKFGHKEFKHNGLPYDSSSYVVSNIKLFLSGRCRC